MLYDGVLAGKLLAAAGGAYIHRQARDFGESSVHQRVVILEMESSMLARAHRCRSMLVRSVCRAQTVGRSSLEGIITVLLR